MFQNRRCLRQRIVAAGASTTILLGMGLAAMPGTAHAAVDPAHAAVNGHAWGAAGKVTVNLPPTPKAVINIPQLALQTTKYCALPVDGDTYETTLSSTKFQTAPSPERLVLGAQVMEDKGVVEVTPTTVGLTESSKITGLTALAGGVTATALHAVAHTTASDAGFDNHTAAGDSAPSGLTVANLNIFGETFNGDVPPNTKIDLPGPSYVILNEQIPNAGGITVNGIHLFLSAFQGFTTNLVIAHAYTNIKTHISARYTATAYAAWLKAKVGPTAVDTGTLAPASVPCIGGSSTNEIASISRSLPGGGTFLSTGTGKATATAVNDPAPTVDATEDIQNVNLLNGLVKAAAINVKAHAQAVGSVVHATGDTSFVNLVVNGQSVGANPPPNTKINLPGLGYVIVNQQTCQSGTPAACSAAGTNRMSVVGLRLVVTNPDNPFNIRIGADVRVGVALAGLTV